MKVCWRYSTLDMNTYSSIMYENTLKTHKIKGPSITYSHIWHIDISKFAYWFNTHFVKVWWRYVLQKQMSFIFVMCFSDIADTCPKKQSRKKCGVDCWNATDRRRQNSEITDRHFIFLSDLCLYTVHLSPVPFFQTIILSRNRIQPCPNFKYIKVRV